MKNICRILIVAIVFVFISGIISLNEPLKAEDFYSYECGNDYEVSWITDEGKFQKVACFTNFKDAKDKMKELGGDHVVRHASSLSPSKIIAMNSGNAYSYPTRNKNNSSTLKIYEHSDDRSIYKKNTYIANHYEMNYIDTDRYFPSINGGLIKVLINGFEGYADLEYTDLVPSKFLDKGLAIFLGGNDATTADEKPFLVVPRRNYYIVREKDGLRELVYVYHRAYCHPDKQNKLDEEHSFVVGSAPTELVTDVKYYSNNGYDFYTSPDYANKATTYYSYYQYLPLRTKSNISADMLNNAFNNLTTSENSVLKNSGEYFIEAQEKYGINALLLYSMAVHESGWGTSSIALKTNNIFGWNAIDSNPGQATTFSSVEACILEHAGYNLRLYLDIDDPRFFSMSLGNKGSGLNVKYASDPYWGMKIAGIAYQIDKVNRNNGQFNDLNMYNLMRIDEFDASFYKEASSNSEVMYKSSYGPSYQKDFIITKINEDNNMIKVQSANPIIDGKVVWGKDTSKQMIEYNFDESVLYLKNDILSPINYVDPNLPKPDGNYIKELDSFNWDDDYLYLSGKAYMSGITVDETNIITNKVIFFNDKDNETYTLESNTNDGITSFNGSIDLNKLNEGTYQIKVETTYSKYGIYNNSFMIEFDNIPETKVINGYKYTFYKKNGKMMLEKTKYASDDTRLISMINSINLNDNGLLKLDGLAFRTGSNYINEYIINHTLEIIDIVKDEVIDTFDLETYEVNNIGLNDGFEYKYIGFRGQIDLSDLEKGSYTFKIKTTNGDISDSIIINSTMEKHILNHHKIGNLIYKLTTNSLYNYRFELDIENDAIDYSIINKNSIINSVGLFERLKLENDNLLYYGLGYMDEINFKKSNNAEYDLHLVSEDGDKYTIKTNTVACKFDYSSVIKNGYDLSNACFEGEYKLSDLPVGNYEMYIQINVEDQNEKFVDIFNLINNQNSTYKPSESNGKCYTIYISDDRYRMNLKVEEIN